MNDLWRYDPASNTWTWYNGDKTRNESGVYGTLGLSSVSNKPGARSSSVSVTNGNGLLWLLGGNGYAQTGPQGFLNDLWRYDPNSNKWTWIHGDTTRNTFGVYGTLGVPADTLEPGSRSDAAFWYDGAGKLWLFGGDGYAESNTGRLNDLWSISATCINVFFRDADNDGFGDPDQQVLVCVAPAGYVTNNRDCDDTKSVVHRGAQELCDGIDNDCDGLVDEDIVLQTYYLDEDGDGFGAPLISQQRCTGPSAGYVSNAGDCDDSNAAIHPNAAEICDGIDNDCDGQVDDGLPVQKYYRDEDGDGYGTADSSIMSCSLPAGYVSNDQDCDDNNASVKPGAVELCDGVDNDCDGQVDEGVKTIWYRDSDGDGFGDALNTQESCSAPAGYVASGTDCDDTEITIYPGALEICDGQDNNCDGIFDPEEPSNLVSTPGDGTALIAFNAPFYIPGFPILNYEYKINGGPWVPLMPADTSSPVTITGLANWTTYNIRIRAVYAGGSCLASLPVSVTPDGDPLWNGSVSTDWNDPNNWSPEGVPLPGADITVPSGLTNYPILDTDRTIGRLILQTGASLTLNSKTLAVNGIITGNGVLTGSPQSGLVLNGTGSVLNFNQASASTRSLGSLSLNAGSTAALGTAMDIHGALTLNQAGLDLSGRNLTLRSTATATARVGDLTGSLLSNATNVTVERYIPQTLGSNNIGRRWRVITSPVMNTTINTAWQHGGTWNGTTPLSGTTGTLINMNKPGNAATANAKGYDFWSAVASAGASICWYRQGTTQGVWSPLESTLAAGAFNNNQAYLLYIRGPRSSTYSTGTASAITTLRPTGTLKQGDVNIAIPANTGFNLIGNPYASPLDFDKVYNNPGNSAIIKRQFWVWDASLGDAGNYKLIKYLNGQYIEMPSGAPTSLTLIQSGQGFFVESLVSTGGNLLIRESNKSVTAPTPANVLFSRIRMKRLEINLTQRQSDGSDLLMDGVVTVMNTRYHIGPVDADDVMKPVATDGHFSIKRGNASLMLDARPLVEKADTMQLETRDLGRQEGHFRFRAEEMSEFRGKAWLRDAYRNMLTQVKLDGSETVVAFSMDDHAASSAVDRFSLILAADALASGQTVEATGPGKVKVYPNPVMRRVVNIRFEGMPAGLYHAELINPLGQLVMRREWKYEGGKFTGSMTIPYNAVSGMYHLRCMKDGKLITHESLIME